MSSSAPEQSRLASALSEQREAVREQLMAAWQLHVSRIEEQLNAGWREQIERVFEDRFAELASRLEPVFGAEAERARREFTEELNRAVRRLGQARTQEEWAIALADSAQLFASRAAVFAVSGTGLKGLGSRGLAAAGLEIPIAPAFANAIATRESVAAPRTPGELSETLAALLGPDTAGCGHLFPILAQERVAAVLYADGDSIDVNGLETITALAGATLRPAPTEARPALPDWSQLSREEQDLNLRAQRFARVRVAEMRLYKAQAVRSGRARQNVYAALKEEIDSAREAFRRDFTSASPVLPDYLHLELIRTLANDDVAVLGEDYPGSLF